MRALGVDFGGVINQPADDSEDTSFRGDNYLRTPAMPGAFEGVAALTAVFDGRVWVVSKCGERTERRTREWLAHHGFHELTGVGPERLRFCRTREGKAPIAAELGLTHFVDDHMEVLGHLVTVPHRYLFQPIPTQTPGPGVRPVRSWRDLVAELGG